MTLNFPGPAEYRLLFTSSGRRHQFRCSFVPSAPINVGDDMTAVLAIARDATTPNSWLEFNSLYAFIQDIYSAADTSFTSLQLWTYAPGTFDATFIDENAIGQAGGSVNPAEDAGQMIFAFRTTNGGVMKSVLMESTYGPQTSLFPPLAAALNNIANEYLKAASIWRARDDGFASACTGVHPGLNEALFKKLFRP